VTLLVDSLYVEEIEAVSSPAASSASSPKLVWILGEIHSEARLWNLSQSVNIAARFEKIPSHKKIQDVEND
jgi:hypothetical protein